MTVDSVPMRADGVLFLTEDGAAEWVSERTAAVATIGITVGGGCLIHVDAAAPGEPLRWTVPPGSDGSELARAVGDSGLVGVLAQARRDGTTRHRILAAHSLNEPWVRFAEVEALARWAMRPLHRGALAIDRAVAAHAVGYLGDARAWFTRAEHTLIDLGARYLDGELPDTAADLVYNALLVAAEAGIDGEFPDLSPDRPSHAQISDTAVLEVITRWDRTGTAASAAGAIWTLGGDENTDPDRDVGFIDIRAVPPRIIAWSGSDQPELLIEYDSGADTFAVTAWIADDVDPRCREVRQLIAYAARRADGALVATAPVRLQGRSLVAGLPAASGAIGELIFGILDAATDIDELRTDQVGRCLTEVDRTMIDAWGRARAATAALYTVSAMAGETALYKAQSEHRSRMRIVRSLVSTARARLERELAQLESIPTDPESDAAHMDAADRRALITLLRARDIALARYVRSLRHGEVAEPALAELIPPQPDE
ncbi:hypothetical protein GFY24_30335 [Nocardia sp. SYP-A9097]|uniref:hypothetical protein n=1 Tax=Nocardia sp. SYP-A9097 TaxID=2663237 RepID=UPI00129AB926|nr:hypothetical protein [Nocardia sp. SYP-A9097]MRH91689.1 hypothetical protein [Nocardia sp. SYP-A9097]